MRAEDRFHGIPEVAHRGERKEALFYLVIAALVLMTVALVVIPGIVVGA